MTDREKLIDIKNQIITYLNDEAPVSDFQVTLSESDRATATWTPHRKGLMDIEYYRPEIDKKWQHSVQRYREPILIADGQTSIGFNAPIERALFRVKLGEWTSEIAEVRSVENDSADPIEEPIPDPVEEPVTEKEIPIGFWDHYTDKVTLPNELLEVVTVGKSMQRRVDAIHVPSIMHLGNLQNENTSQRKKRVESIADFAQDNTIIIHFIDEPLSKNVSGDELDELVAYARSLYGDRFKYAYTINSAELYYPENRAVQSYAQDFDYVFHQAYPYRVEYPSSYLRGVDDTKDQFFASLDLRLKTLKEKIPNSKFWMVGQTFHGQKWRIPPVESMGWYIEWCRRNVEGLLFWLYESGSGWTGLEDMPEHRQKLIEVLNE